MNEDLYISVKKYLSGELSEEERQLFESQVEEDEHFRSQAQLYTSMLQAIQHKGDEELNDELMTLGKSLLQKEQIQPNEAKVKRFNIPAYVYAIAAAILLLILIIPIWPSQSYTTEQLFISNFEAPYSGVRGDDDLSTKIDSLEQQWSSAYNDKDYPIAIPILGILLADTTYQNRSSAHYYLGISQLALGNAEAAIEAFENIEEGFEYQRELQWYTALAWLKQDDIAEAKTRLQAIVDDPFFQQKKDLRSYYEKAEDILKKLPKE